MKEDCFNISIPNQHVGLLYENGPIPEVGLHLQQWYTTCGPQVAAGIISVARKLSKKFYLCSQNRQIKDDFYFNDLVHFAWIVKLGK